MKILVLNGSPRKGGNTEALVNAFKEGAESNGHEVDVINVYNQNINGCLACNYCHGAGNGKCIQQDGMQELYPLIDEMDMLVLATPVYYYNFTGPLQCAISRFYPCSLANKKVSKTALIMSSGSPDVYESATLAYKNSFADYLGLEDMGVFTAYGSQNKSPEKLEELRAFGASL